MTTTPLVLAAGSDRAQLQRASEVLEADPGVARVLVRGDRGRIYVRHSAARAPRGRLLERLREEGVEVRVQQR